MTFSRFTFACAVVLAGALTGGCAGSGPTEPPPGEVVAEAPGSMEPVETGESASSETESVAEAIAAGDPSGYVLDNGDVIGIQVFDEPDLTLEARVGSSGVINYSYLGDLQVAGRTPLELERTISKQLRDGFLVNPSVNITVVQYRPFFINGEVRSPGGYPYQPGLTLGRAIALAGGVTDRASTRKMFVMKATAAEDEEKERERVDMSYRISPGDVISINEGFF